MQLKDRVSMTDAWQVDFDDRLLLHGKRYCPLTGGFVMTTSQKARISQMRLDGESYATIADALGLSRNTVKSFCLRNIRYEPNKKPVSALTGTCDQCGKGFVLCPGHRQRRFCSDHCRMSWWNVHRDLLNSKDLVEQTCACCGKHFMGYERQHRKYCSHACYIAHRYEKERTCHE